MPTLPAPTFSVAAVAREYRTTTATMQQIAARLGIDSTRLRVALMDHLGNEGYQRMIRERRAGHGGHRGHCTYRTRGPEPDEIVTATAELREADRAARAARPPEQTKEARRLKRMESLHPRIREAVMAATAVGGVESWAEED